MDELRLKSFLLFFGSNVSSFVCRRQRELIRFFKLNFPCLSFLSTRNENFLFVYLFTLSGKRSESDLRIHVSHRRVNLPRGYVYLHREKKKNYQRRETFFLGKSWSDFSRQVYTTIQSNQKFKRATVTRQSVCYQATLKP